MTCGAVREKLIEYAAGELAQDETQVVAEHLAACAKCRAEVEAFRRAEEALAALRVVEAAPELSADLDRRISARQDGSRRWAWAAAGAVALALVVAAVLLWPRGEQVERPGLDQRPPTRAAEAERAAPRPMPSRAPATEAPSGERIVVPAPVEPAVVAPRRPAQTAAPRLVADSPPVESGPLPAESLPVTPADTPRVSSLETVDEAPTSGLLLLLGGPQPARPLPEVHLDISFPDGSRSVFDQRAPRGAEGEARAVHVTYEYMAPQMGLPQNGG